MQCNTSVKNKFHSLEKKTKTTLIQTMSLTANNPTMVQSSLEIGYQFLGLEWIPQSQITGTEPTQSDNVYYAIRNDRGAMLLLLGSDETCTPILVSEFTRIYSLPTPEHNHDVSHFRRYPPIA